LVSFSLWRAALAIFAVLALAALALIFARGRLTLTDLSPLGFREKPSSAPQRELVPVSGLNFAVDNHPFTAKGLAELVPAKVDLYVEGRDPRPFFRAVLSSEDWKELEGTVLERTGLTLDEAASFLEDDFAVVQEGTASAFFARGRDLDFLAQQLRDQEVLGEWRANLVGGFLVITDSPELTAKIEAAFNKQTLNLTLTSSFVEARKDIPPGQIFVYGTRRPWFLPPDIAIDANAYVVAKKGGETVLIGL
jgi:hypothetical protein